MIFLLYEASEQKHVPYSTIFWVNKCALYQETIVYFDVFN